VDEERSAEEEQEDGDDKSSSNNDEVAEEENGLKSDSENIRSSVDREDLPPARVKTKAARKAPVKWAPREAKDKSRTKGGAKRSASQSPTKLSPTRTPMLSPVRSANMSPVVDLSAMPRGKHKIFFADRASTSRVYVTKVKTSSEIVRPTLGKGKVKGRPPDKKAKPPVVEIENDGEWDSELLPEEEDKLVQQVQDFRSQGLPLTMEVLLDYAQNILNENPYRMRSFIDNRPNKEWYQMFMKYHPVLSSPVHVTASRQTARQISREEERKRKSTEPAKKQQTSANKKTKKNQTKTKTRQQNKGRKRKNSQADFSYSEVDESVNAGTTTEEEIDTNICSMCQAEYNDEPGEWIGCSSCERWFHKICIHIDVTGYSDKEIEELDFICEFCSCVGDVT
jgi:hypothetical protein